MSAAAPYRSAIRDPASGRPFARVLMLGVMWGAAVSAMEAVSLPLADGSWASFWLFLFGIMPVWCAVGVGIAWFAERAGWRLERPLFLAASVAVGALALSAAASLLFSLIEAVPGPDFARAKVFPKGSDPVASFLYQTWVVLFYGGLYVFASMLNQRAERTRGLLDRTRLARLRSETELDEAKLQTLRGHVDPRFLLRVMQEVERRYADAAAAADRLLDLLVAFLRLAMPGVRSGQSTLAAELALARAYADLWRNLDHTRASWKIETVGPTADVPFPPLLLMPLLDRLAATSTGPARGGIRVETNDRAVTIAFKSASSLNCSWVTAELAYRIRVGLSTLFGTRWSMSFQGASEAHGPDLLLTLYRLPATVNDSTADSTTAARARKETIDGNRP